MTYGEKTVLYLPKEHGGIRTATAPALMAHISLVLILNMVLVLIGQHSGAITTL